MASISVPIERNKFAGGPGGIGGVRGSDMGSSGRFHDGNYRQSLHQDNGPPYIVKLLSLPVTADDFFIEDLFRSRYTTFVKFKIVIDPVSNILETNIIKKVAFAELESFQDLSKVLKWQDLYYKPGRRIAIELADFNDFQNCMSFNQTHYDQIQQIQQDFISGKIHPHHQSNHNQPHFPPHLSPHRNNNSALHHGGEGRHHPYDNSRTPHQESPPLSKPKPNPFGAAKPVDVVSKQHEIDKKLININHTTVRTLGNPDLKPDEESHFNKLSPEKHSVHLLKRSPVANNKHGSPSDTNLIPAPLPENTYNHDDKRSLAELLSAKPDEDISNLKKNSPKPTVFKPVILKKKHPSQEINLTTKEGDSLKSQANDNENNEVEIKHSENDEKPKQFLEDQNNESQQSNGSQKTPGTVKTKINRKPKQERQNQRHNRKGRSNSNDVGYEKISSSLKDLELLSNSTKHGDNESLTESSNTDNNREGSEIQNDGDSMKNEERPNFKRHFDELSKRPYVPREKSNKSNNFTRGHKSHKRGSRTKENHKKNENGDDISTEEWKPKLDSDAKVTQAIENSTKGLSKTLSNKKTSPSKTYNNQGNRSKNETKKSIQNSEKSEEKEPEPEPEQTVSKENSEETKNENFNNEDHEQKDTKENIHGTQNTNDAKDFEAKGEALQKDSMTEGNKAGGRYSSRGKENYRGRGHSRGTNRGRGRGRGGRGKANYNLHYVRKSEENPSA